MYRKAVNKLRGEVTVRCRSDAPERVVNLCACHGIPFWDVLWEGEDCLRLRTTPEGARLLKEAAEETAQVEVLSSSGVPAALHRLRRRYVLLASAVLAVLWLWCASSIILTFSVSGNETVSTTQILRALERNGVTVGTRGLDIHQEQLRNRVLLELHDLSWLSVNVQGCTAHVQVVERQRPPTVYDPAAAANVVAEKAGLITRIQALNGVTKVREGEIVTEGQLLLSGVADGRFGGVRFMHACGEVWGRTWYTLTARVPLERMEKEEEGRTQHQFSLIVGKKRINFYAGGSIRGTECDTMTTYHPLRLPFGGELPVKICHRQVTPCTWQRVTYTEEEALAEAKASLLEGLTAQLHDGGSVRSTVFTHRIEGDTLVVTVQSECFEQLGVETPIEYGE